MADGGGLLGDEPGLGKTVQIITVLEALVRARLARRILIIAPANLRARGSEVMEDCTTSSDGRRAG